MSLYPKCVIRLEKEGQAVEVPTTAHDAMRCSDGKWQDRVSATLWPVYSCARLGESLLFVVSSAYRRRYVATSPVNSGVIQRYVVLASCKVS